MRKKTIEEELKEIAEEKEEHIDTLTKEFILSSDDHGYDFGNVEKKKKKLQIEKKIRKLYNEYFKNKINKEKLLERLNEIDDDELVIEMKMKILNEKIEKSKSQENFDITEEFLEQTSFIEENQNVDNTAETDPDLIEFKKMYINNKNNQTSAEPAKEVTIKSSTKRGKILPVLFCSIFVIVGFCVSLFGGIIPWAKSSAYIEIPATVIEVRTYIDDEGDLMAVITYQYVYENKPYVKEASYAQSASLSPNVGDIIKIRIDPNNPNNVIDDNFVHIILTFFGIVFMSFGIFAVIMAIKSKK